MKNARHKHITMDVAISTNPINMMHMVSARENFFLNIIPIVLSKMPTIKIRMKDRKCDFTKALLKNIDSGIK